MLVPILPLTTLAMNTTSTLPRSWPGLELLNHQFLDMRTWWRVCVFATSMTKVGKAPGPSRYWVGSNPSSGSLAQPSGWIES